jgi:aryl-alcohol dehydrogenase-like predicted oxidoreductase
MKVSRIAWGTGTIGGGKASNQTRLGMKKFVEMAHHAYDRGITFFDMADSYGSHPYVGKAIKSLDSLQDDLFKMISMRAFFRKQISNVIIHRQIDDLPTVVR